MSQSEARGPGLVSEQTFPCPHGRGLSEKPAIQAGPAVVAESSTGDRDRAHVRRDLIQMRTDLLLV